MDITYLGHSSFKLRGRGATVITDPYNSKFVGLRFPKIEADIVTVSHQHQDHNEVSMVLGSPVVVSGPGEYEIKGIRITGLPSYHDSVGGKERGKNTLYSIKIDGVYLVHLGDLGHKLGDDDIERLNGVDVLMIPIGGVYTINSKEALQVVSSLEPKIIIPMHYQRPNLNQDNFGKLEPVSLFLKEMGKEGITPQPKLNITKDKLPVEQMVVVLE